jgi:predicted nucleic acid-binding protein
MFAKRVLIVPIVKLPKLSAVPRVYADTSVFGGVFDEEFRSSSRALFERVRKGEIRLVTSAVVEDELEPAPARVRGYYRGLLRFMHKADLTEQSLALRNAYVRAGIVTKKSAADALHVAIATSNLCSVLVSWNCRHIVHFQKIPLYNAVNRLHGFAEIAIHTPLEVVNVENESI